MYKRELYQSVEFIRQKYSISEYPLDTVSVLGEVNNLFLEFYPFVTTGLRGIAKPMEGGKCVVILNSQRSKVERNFDFAHEFMHFCLHSKVKTGSFQCFEKVCSKQNVFIEWQANEGAAELIIPYKALLPLIKEKYKKVNLSEDILGLRNDLAKEFNVTSSVIEIRLESLKYEIHQYLSGCDLDKIKILSLSEQKKHKIRVNSLNTLEQILFKQEIEALKKNTRLRYSNMIYR